MISMHQIQKLRVIIGLLLFVGIATTLQAQVPQTINFQGYLTNAAGAPLTGSYSMTFKFYTVATGSTALWTETQTVPVTNGVYNVLLGSITPILLITPTQYYLGVTVDADAEMTPRTALTSVMSALFLENVAIRGSNTSVGVDAGAKTSGVNNTFLGCWAGHANGTGDNNTFLGDMAGYLNSTGYQNTFVGEGAGRYNSTGYNNTFVGKWAGYANDTGAGNVFIGYEAGRYENGSDLLYIANSSTMTPLIYGEFDNTLVRIYGDLDVTGSTTKAGGGSWTSSSDQRLKDVQGPFTRGLEALNQLQPVAYRYKAGNPLNLPSDVTYIGLIAQEVQPVIPEAVSTGRDGYLTLNSDPILWTMLNAIKQLQAENQTLRQELEALKARINP